LLALVGENGAGKSTLMKVLSGVWPYPTYEGDIYIRGELKRFGNTKDAEASQVAIIYQELNLIPELTVAEAKNFSITEITSISGFPADVNMIAAAQMGPAGELFAQPVTLNFDVTGIRSPGTVLIGFQSDSSGERLRLVPLRDTLGTMGYYSTALDGNQVSIDVVGFSNIGIVEALAEEVPGLLRAFLFQGKDFEVPEEFVLRLFNLALDSAFTTEEIDDMADNMLADMIRLRRMELAEIISDFIDQPEMTSDDLIHYLDINLAMLLTNVFDLTGEDPITSSEELADSIGLLVDLAEVYGAGLHLQCFAGPTDLVDLEGALDTAGAMLLLRIAEDLLLSRPELSFEDLAATAEDISQCFSQTVLEAYFESFDLPASDEFAGTATDIVSRVTDNLQGSESSESLADMATDLQFIEPELISTSPLTIGFKEVSDRVTGLYTDTARIVLDSPEDGERNGRLELADEETFSVATTSAAQEKGERPFITFNLSNIASGPIVISSTSIDIAYAFDSLETNNGLLENITRNLTGNATVTKSFTPLSFADEIELYD
jgi:ABC-type sugar transport system ATPase subunit